MKWLKDISETFLVNFIIILVGIEKRRNGKIKSQTRNRWA